MKKLLVVALLLGGGWLAYTRWFQPERRACARMATLCGESARDDLRTCESDLKDLRKAFGDGALEKLESCVAQAQSCPESAGCMVGASARGVGDAMKSFIDGVQKSVSK
jgi:hypothetical protein